jgi:hypothetical protein
MEFLSNKTISSCKVSRNPSGAGICDTRELLGPFADDYTSGYEEQQEIAVGRRPRNNYVMDLYKGT